MISIEREEPIEVDPAPPHAGLENGHAPAASEHPESVQGKTSPPPHDFPHEHTAPVAMRMPHLPITATTKTAELKGPDSPGSPGGSRSSPVCEASAAGQSAASTNQTQPIECPVQPGDAISTSPFPHSFDRFGQTAVLQMTTRGWETLTLK
ncbi:hypothetical protein EYF80_062475 [Liparis tanakae]|uniref:Uncharacterized protein n=1 Tax=Liparis tanakae TaxID=230148 RepID=A0A4Z2EGD8_9TELE|nr:hypothetical protein EYF80_062475 [Liparis tanakae]